MANKVGNREYDKLDRDAQNLNQLRSFRDQWSAPDKRIRDIWTSFRLLPLKVAYLIASHYHYDIVGWSLTTKWKLYTKFDKKLLKNEDPGRISSSINSAVEVQQKIVGLQKVVATLKDTSKTRQDKAHAYENLNKDHPLVYRDVIHKIQITKCPKFERKAEFEIKEQPDGCSKIVIEELLDLYRKGYREVGDHMFKDLIKKTSP